MKRSEMLIRHEGLALVLGLCSLSRCTNGLWIVHCCTVSHTNTSTQTHHAHMSKDTHVDTHSSSSTDKNRHIHNLSYRTKINSKQNDYNTIQKLYFRTTIEIQCGPVYGKCGYLFSWYCDLVL